MTHSAALISLATAVPPHVFQQKQVATVARELFSDRYPEFERLSKVFGNTGIQNRYAVKPIEWYFEPRGWPERTQAFLEGADALFMEATRLALKRANLAPSEIDTIVTVSSTG